MNTVTSQHSIQAGRKGASLSAMLAARLPILPGFIVSSHAFLEFCDFNNLKIEINTLLKNNNPNNPSELTKASKAIHRLIREAEFPTELIKEILPMYLKFGQGRVFLSPSLFLEDTKNSIFGSTEHSFYGFEGEANLFEGMKEVWSHFFDPKPLFYRLKHHQEHFNLPFAICVQRHPVFEVTGVLYTCDPTASDKNTCLVKAVRGEDGLIQNLDGADYYWISKSSKEELKNVVDKQSSKIIWNQGETVEKKIGKLQQQQKKLPPIVTAELGKIAQKLQQHFFFPQVATFGWDRHKVWLIDVKPLEIQPSTGSHLPSDHSVLSKTPLSVQPDEKKTKVLIPAPTVGIMHELTIDAHLPALVPSGHVLLQPTAIFQSLTGGTSLSSRVVSHEIYRILSFLFTHIHTALGFLYEFDVSHPEVFGAQLETFIALRRKYASIPLGIVFLNITDCSTYEQQLKSFGEAGLIRASTLHFYLEISIPSAIHTIEPCVKKGLDGSLINLDQITMHLHGGRQIKSDDFSSPAVIEYVQSAVRICNQNGIRCLIKSSHLPCPEILDVVKDLGIVEWIGTSQTLRFVQDHIRS